MTDVGTDAGNYTIKPLSAETWEAYAALAEKHNGVWGGCFCTWFHPRRKAEGLEDVVEAGRPYKELLVREGRAHAALVFDGDAAVAWCQYGTPEELPNIYHRREYLAGLEQAPDYRTTCFFVDRDYRRKGLALVALQGALELIAKEGGGVVEGYPQDTPGQKTSASFLYSATRTVFEEAGFEYERAKGTKNCVMRTTVAAG
jgi:GNAT superfamily N-acetyltransferase